MPAGPPANAPSTQSQPQTKRRPKIPLNPAPISPKHPSALAAAFAGEDKEPYNARENREISGMSKYLAWTVANRASKT